MSEEDAAVTELQVEVDEASTGDNVDESTVHVPEISHEIADSSVTEEEPLNAEDIVPPEEAAPVLEYAVEAIAVVEGTAVEGEATPSISEVVDSTGIVDVVSSSVASEAPEVPTTEPASEGIAALISSFSGSSSMIPGLNTIPAGMSEFMTDPANQTLLQRVAAQIMASSGGAVVDSTSDKKTPTSAAAVTAASATNFLCCAKCNGRGVGELRSPACVCRVPSFDRKKDITVSGCNNCGCKGCHVYDITGGAEGGPAGSSSTPRNTATSDSRADRRDSAPHGDGGGSGGGGAYSGDSRSHEICRDNLKGSCSRGTSCRFAHTRSSDSCRDFAIGRCSRGDACRYDHGAASGGGGGRSGGDSSHAHSSGGDRDRRSSGGATESNCRDFARGLCTRGSGCRFGHGSASSSYSGGRDGRDRSPPRRGGRDDSRYDASYSSSSRGGSSSSAREVCRDYSIGKCTRGSSCRFSHDDSRRGSGGGSGSRGGRDSSPPRHREHSSRGYSPPKSSRHSSDPYAAGGGSRYSDHYPPARPAPTAPAPAYMDDRAMMYDRGYDARAMPPPSMAPIDHSAPYGMPPPGAPPVGAYRPDVSYGMPPPGPGRPDMYSSYDPMQQQQHQAPPPMGYPGDPYRGGAPGGMSAPYDPSPRPYNPAEMPPPGGYAMPPPSMDGPPPHYAAYGAPPPDMMGGRKRGYEESMGGAPAPGAPGDWGRNVRSRYDAPPQSMPQSGAYDPRM